MNSVDQSVLNFITQTISGKGGTDSTTFIWQNGSVCTTIPATPDHFRNNEAFKNIRHLPPVKQYSGRMQVDRQLGGVKKISFEG